MITNARMLCPCTAPVRVRGCLIDGSDPVTCEDAGQSCDQSSCDPESVDRVPGVTVWTRLTLKNVPLPCLPLSLNHYPHPSPHALCMARKGTATATDFGEPR